jgi:hypothetical protein
MFAASVFLVANVVAVTTLWRKQRELQESVMALRDEQLEAQSLLADKEMWRQRADALDKQPVLGSAGQANAELLETVTSSARRHSITIVDQGFAEPGAAHKADFREIAVKLTVNGSLEAITRWLWEIQQPGKFQAVPSFSMKLDSDPSKIICKLTVARYYAP